MTGDHPSVRIEPWGDGDLPLLERLVGDPAMMAHLGGPESRERIAERQARYRQPGSRQYRIVEPGDRRGRRLGRLLASRVAEERGVRDRLGGGAGVSGAGLARAAAALVIAIARAEREPRFMHAYPSVDNAPSNAICRRLGFQLAGAVDFEYPPGTPMRCNDWRLDLAAG